MENRHEKSTNQPTRKAIKNQFNTDSTGCGKEKRKSAHGTNQNYSVLEIKHAFGEETFFYCALSALTGSISVLFKFISKQSNQN